jgi:hypothetical protein
VTNPRESRRQAAPPHAKKCETNPMTSFAINGLASSAWRRWCAFAGRLALPWEKSFTGARSHSVDALEHRGQCRVSLGEAGGLLAGGPGIHAVTARHGHRGFAGLASEAGRVFLLRCDAGHIRRKSTAPTCLRHFTERAGEASLRRPKAARSSTAIHERPLDLRFPSSCVSALRWRHGVSEWSNAHKRPGWRSCPPHRRRTRKVLPEPTPDRARRCGGGLPGQAGPGCCVASRDFSRLGDRLDGGSLAQV